MDVKKTAMWTAGIFIVVIILSTMIGSCAGPNSAGANQGQMNGQNNGSWGGGQPGYNNGSGSNGWLWGLGGAAAGYWLGNKFGNKQPTHPNPDPYKERSPQQNNSGTTEQTNKTLTSSDVKPKPVQPTSGGYKPSAPASSYKSTPSGVRSSSSSSYKPSKR